MTFIIFKNEHKKLFADKVCKKCGKTFVPKNSGRQAYCGSIRDKNTCAYIHNIEYRLQYQEHWNKLRRVNDDNRMGKLKCSVCSVGLFKTRCKSSGRYNERTAISCKRCGSVLCGRHAMSYVDENNTNITKYAANYCVKCAKFVE